MGSPHVSQSGWINQPFPYSIRRLAGNTCSFVHRRTEITRVTCQHKQMRTHLAESPLLSAISYLYLYSSPPASPVLTNTYLEAYFYHYSSIVLLKAISIFILMSIHKYVFEHCQQYKLQLRRYYFPGMSCRDSLGFSCAKVVYCNGIFKYRLAIYNQSAQQPSSFLGTG